MFFPLFLERCVDRSIFSTTLPTPWFYILNPLALFFFGPFIGILFKNTGSSLTHDFGKKILYSFTAMASALLFATLSAYMPPLSLTFMILVYSVMFVGGFLLVPLAQSLISQFEEEHSKRLLMGTLYLSMALARYGGSFISQYLLDKTPQMSLLDFESAFTKLLMLSIVLTLFYAIGFKKA